MTINMDAEKLYRAALDAYGKEAQMKMAIEECSELINALCKDFRGRVNNDAVATEIADVMIMCAQMALIYGKDNVLNEVYFKQCRLADRLCKGGFITGEEAQEIIKAGE